jgi:hypothetical protein
LADIGRKLGVASRAPQRPKVDQTEVAMDQLGERLLGTVLDVATKQFSIFNHVQILNTADEKTGQKSPARSWCLGVSITEVTETAAGG